MGGLPEFWMQRLLDRLTPEDVLLGVALAVVILWLLKVRERRKQ